MGPGERGEERLGGRRKGGQNFDVGRGGGYRKGKRRRGEAERLGRAGRSLL